MGQLDLPRLLEMQPFPLQQRPQELVARAARGGHQLLFGPHRRSDALAQQRHEELLLGLEVMVEAALADADPVGHVVEGRLPVAHFGEDRQRGRHDFTPSLVRR